MVSELTKACGVLKENLENRSVWTETLSKAADLKTAVQERLTSLKDPERLAGVRRKLLLVKKKRARVRRRKTEEREDVREREVRRAEREAAVDKWLTKRIQEVEEKNRVRERLLLVVFVIRSRHFNVVLTRRRKN